jgi:CSLREA domain-containing protein
MGRGCGAAAVLIGAWALLGPIAPAAGARVEVDSTADSFGSADGRCSLREAVESVNRAADFGGCAAAGSYGYYDVVVLRRRAYRLSLPSLTEGVMSEDPDNSGGDLDLLGGNQVVLVSFASHGAVIDAAGFGRVLEIANAGATMLIQGVTIRGGRTAGDGGGLLTYGDAILLMSALVGNEAGGRGGAVAAIGPRADVTVLNSTLSGNRAARGGGVALLAGTDDTMLDLYSSTVSRNAATRAGGILVESGAARIENTILALNRAGRRLSD